MRGGKSVMRGMVLAMDAKVARMRRMGLMAIVLLGVALDLACAVYRSSGVFKMPLTVRRCEFGSRLDVKIL